MYLDCTIKIPDSNGKITKKTIKGTGTTGSHCSMRLIRAALWMFPSFSIHWTRQRGSFEDNRKNSIRPYKVNGTTIRRKLYADDKKERYFHIYYSDSKKQSEREMFGEKIDREIQLCGYSPSSGAGYTPA